MNRQKLQQKHGKHQMPFSKEYISITPFLGNNFFVLIDAFSKWPEVFITRDMTSTTTIQKCRQVFSTFGIPEVIVSDNGRHFRSHEFANFLQVNGIEHKTTAPFYPATNGQAERFIQTMKLAFKKKFLNSTVSIAELNKVLQQFLFHYRTTPHQTTGVSPAKKIFNRELRTRLSLLLPANCDTCEYDTNKPKIREFDINDRVACRNYYGKDKWLFGKIQQRIGRLHYHVQLDAGKIWKRHVDQLRKVGDIPTQIVDKEYIWDYEPPDTDVSPEESEMNIREEEPSQRQKKGSTVRGNEQATPRRSKRTRATPQRFGNPVTL